MNTDELSGMNRSMRMFFDTRAATWDEIMGPKHAQKLEEILTLFDFDGTSSLLDVGCGTGVLFPLVAAKMQKNAEIVGLDISMGMLEAFHRRLRIHIPDTPGTPRLYLVQGDLLDAPFRLDTFDRIVCNSCFPHFHDQRRAMCAMAGLLKRHGMILICHTQGREGINALHRATGHAVGGQELPELASLCSMLSDVGLECQYGEDGPDRYILIATKRG